METNVYVNNKRYVFVAIISIFIVLAVGAVFLFNKKDDTPSVTVVLIDCKNVGTTTLSATSNLGATVSVPLIVLE